MTQQAPLAAEPSFFKRFVFFIIFNCLSVYVALRGQRQSWSTVLAPSVSVFGTLLAGLDSVSWVKVY